MSGTRLFPRIEFGLTVGSHCRIWGDLCFKRTILAVGLRTDYVDREHGWKCEE